MTSPRWDHIRGLVLAAACALAPLAAQPAHAQTSIEVVVNDEAITSYDIAQRARLLQLTTRRSAGAAKKAALEELIDEHIKTQEAKRTGTSVSDAQVDEAFAQIASRTKMSPSQLGKALSRAGVQPSTLKARIGAEMAWAEVVRGRFRRTINISEQEIIAALQKQDGDSEETTTEVTITQLIFVVPRKSSKSLTTKRRGEANDLRKRFSSCEEGLKLTSEYNEVVVKPLGIRLLPELPANIRDSLEGVETGRLGKPVETGNGIEIFAVCNKREIQSDAAARNKVESDLRNKEGEMMSRRYLRELRRNAVIDYR
ncbi:SurA N-terminal domain-containing protein [Breoghania sp. L-A4]|uniref:SurA N-terminal domain-containing protein n=1 Tax=Breoghania sp. L-A4 TaxID=2304600 RepID=UPI0013C324E9|nr:SurA N-terminal domain-containing protein [Breoghania sp. L-A4]